MTREELSENDDDEVRQLKLVLADKQAEIEALKVQLASRDDTPPRAYLQDNWDSQA